MSHVPYASTLGSLIYVMVCTRLDISHLVGVVSRYMKNLGKEHWARMKWVLYYLRDTSGYCITSNCFNDSLCGYVYSYFVGGLEKRRSIGYVFTLASGHNIKYLRNICYIHYGS